MNDSKNTPVVVISLKTAEDRRAAFTQAAAGAAVNWRFFDAHTQPNGIEYDDASAIKHHGRPLQAGEKGAYSSHMAVWRELVADRTADQYLILEDDVIVDWPAVSMLCQIDYRADGIEYLKLFYKFPSPYLPRRRNWPAPGMYVIELYGKPYGAQGYFITKAAAQRFIDLYSHAVRPIDDQVDRFYENGIPNLSLFPFPLIEGYRPSTIGAARFEAKVASVSGARARMAYDRARRKVAMLTARAQQRLHRS